MDGKMMMINLPQMQKFSHKNSNKPFQMSYRNLFSIVFMVLTIVNIISMIIYTSLYLNMIEEKEKTEKHIHLFTPTNHDAYAVVRFLNFASLFVNISLRIFGLIAIGICGKEFAYTEFESSDRKESFTGCLAYTCGMIIMLAAYYVGIVRMAPHDLLIHCILTVIGGTFVAFSLQHSDTYSKELNTISI